MDKEEKDYYTIPIDYSQREIRMVAQMCEEGLLEFLPYTAYSSKVGTPVDCRKTCRQCLLSC